MLPTTTTGGTLAQDYLLYLEYNLLAIHDIKKNKKLQISIYN